MNSKQTEHALHVIAANAWVLYKACVPGMTQGQREIAKFMSNPEAGNLVMEISALHRDPKSGIGHLVSAENEWTWFTDDDGNEIQRPEGTPRITYDIAKSDPEKEQNGYYEQVWIIKSLFDGSQVRWRNCEFIRIFDKV